jgi:hypothetical protein
VENDGKGSGNSMGQLKLLIIFLALLIGLSTGMDMYVAGNFSGDGFNESYISAPGANATGNNNSWLIEWEDNARIPVCCA